MLGDMERKITLVAFMMAIIFSIGLTSIPFSFADISITPGENVLSIDKGTSDLPSPFLRKINPETGATIESVEITLAGEDVKGGKGLAFNPVDGKLYALLKIKVSVDEGAIFLVTLDPKTGVATKIGDTEDKFNALAFNAVGTLFASTPPGDDDDPELLDVIHTLFEMDTDDASTTELCELDDGSGSSLAFNPSDGELYHNVEGELFRIDDTDPDVCDLTTFVHTLSSDFSTALTFRTLTGLFLMGSDGRPNLSIRYR